MGKKNGRLHWIILSFLTIIFLIAGLSIRETTIVKFRIEHKVQVEKEKKHLEKQAGQLKEASDYLTEQFRRYIYTENEYYIQLYWTEANEARRRELAIEELNQVFIPEEEKRLIDQAMNESDSLMKKELWAMRIMEEGKGKSEKELLSCLKTVDIKKEDRELSPFQKKKKARNYAHSPSYDYSKTVINRNIESFRAKLGAREEQELQEASILVQEALKRVQFYNALAVFAVSLLAVVFYLFVILPFLQYYKELEKIGADTEEALRPRGTEEMRAFATMFNSIYLDWKKQKRKLEEINAIDILTGIANRATLDDYIGRLVQEGKANIGMLMMDVDNFKAFNDSYGHLVGDKVLIEMGNCFDRAAVKEGGIAGRLGGEEFIIIVSDVTQDRISKIAASVMDDISQIDPVELGILDRSMRLTISVGSTIWNKGQKGDLNSLIHQADMALYQAKGQGKNRHVIFSEEEDFFILLEHEKTRQKEVESDMYQALEEKEFVPFFQPKYDLETERICGAEALVRWNHHQKGCLYPDYFVPVLERDGFITKIDFAMFEEICRCIKEWTEKGVAVVPVACNFSRLNLGKGTLVPELLKITEAYGVPKDLIQVEITESGLMEEDNAEILEREFAQLREAGFTIAIDDFGTGYSSLGMLHELSADVLKIDKSFLHRDLTLRSNELLIKGILYIAQVMKMETVVEGVETKEQAELLKKLGCRVVQGYYFSKPVEKEEFEKMIKKQG